MWLQERKIPYKERKVSNPQIRKELIILGYTSTPVTIINDEVVVGFNPAKLTAAIERV